MKVNASSHLGLREATLRAVREQMEPGPKRVAQIRALGFMPRPEDTGAAEGTARAKEIVAGPTEWDAYCQRLNAEAEALPEVGVFVVVLPRVKFVSVNDLTDHAHPKQRAGWTMNTRREMQRVIMENIGSIRRVKPPVMVVALQQIPVLRMDNPNLFPKVLLDLLHKRGVTGGKKTNGTPGLAIIEDDRPAVVFHSATHSEKSDVTAAVVTFISREHLTPAIALELILKGRIA